MVPVATVPPRRTVTARSRGLTMRMVAPAVADRLLLSVAVTMRSWIVPFGNGIAVKSNVRVAPEPVTGMGVAVPARFRIVAVMLRSVTPSPVTAAVTPITGGVSPATSMVPRTAVSAWVMVTDGTPGLRVKVELAARLLPTSSYAVMRST